MPRKPNKIEVQRFSDYVREQMEFRGAVLKSSHTFHGERTPRTTYTWTVDTVGGPADISIFGSGFEFFVRFHDLERAKACYRFNLQGSTSGKCNHSFSDRVFRDVKIHLNHVFEQLFRAPKGHNDSAAANTKLGNTNAVSGSAVSKAGG